MSVSRILTLIGALCFAAGCGGGGGGAALPTSDPAAGIYAGTVVANGAPVAGARVSIQGIEATAKTGTDGTFMISSPELAQGAVPAGPGAAPGFLEASVLVDGYDPLVVPVTVGAGQRLDLELVQSALEPTLSISSPTGDRTFVVPDGCTDPRVLVEGFAHLQTPDNYRLDIIVVIDRSGSTERDAFDVDGDDIVDSVLDAELAATECFLEGLDYQVTRVAIVQFNDTAEVVQDFSEDQAELIAALDDVDFSIGGTNYEAAFRKCNDTFVALSTNDDLEEELPDTDSDPLPTPHKAVVFLSDGIPTSHGVPLDTTDSNLTQSADDREAAILAAADLGEDTGAKLYGFSFIPANDSNRPRTTLPHCVTECGGGHYQNIPNMEQLATALCSEPLVPSLEVKIRNVTLDTEFFVTDLFSDGFFSELIPVTLSGPAGPTDPDHTVANTLRVTLTAFGGTALQQSVVEEVIVRLISESDLGSLTDDEVANAHAAPLPVVFLDELETPTGGSLGDDDLFNLLLSDYEDAIELYGVETFNVIDPAGGGAPTVTLDIEFIFKEACYNSDFGYIIVDPNDPPEDHRDALLTIPPTQVLFNSGTHSTACNVGAIPAGDASYQLTVPTGVVVAFFIIPNRTLAQYQANPNHRLKPLFTLSYLNPGGFDQVLTFRSVDGRTEPGASTTVLTPGPMTVFAFEDLSIAARRSDQDFSDVVFTLSSAVVGRVDTLVCD